MEGLNALIAAIKELPNLSSLKCASSRRLCLASSLGKCVTSGNATLLTHVMHLTASTATTSAAKLRMDAGLLHLKQ